MTQEANRDTQSAVQSLQHVLCEQIPVVVRDLSKLRGHVVLQGDYELKVWFCNDIGCI